MNRSVGTTHRVLPSRFPSTTSIRPNASNARSRFLIALSVIRPLSSFKACCLSLASASKAAAILKYKSRPDTVCNSRRLLSSHRFISISIRNKLGSLTASSLDKDTRFLAFLLSEQGICFSAQYGSVFCPSRSTNNYPAEIVRHLHTKHALAAPCEMGIFKLATTHFPLTQQPKCLSTNSSCLSLRVVRS